MPLQSLFTRVVDVFQSLSGSVTTSSALTVVVSPTQVLSSDGVNMKKKHAAGYVMYMCMPCTVA